MNASQWLIFKSLFIQIFVLSLCYCSLFILYIHCGKFVCEKYFQTQNFVSYDAEYVYFLLSTFDSNDICKRTYSLKAENESFDFFSLEQFIYACIKFTYLKSSIYLRRTVLVKVLTRLHEMIVLMCRLLCNHPHLSTKYLKWKIIRNMKSFSSFY